MKGTLSLLFFLLISLNMVAQQSDSVVVLYEISNEDDFRIEGVYVEVNQGFSNTTMISNNRGEAICKVEKFGQLITTFRNVEYSTLTVIEEIYNNSSLDTLRFNITLTSLKTLNLDEVIVSVPGKPEVVFSSEQLSVQDFEIINSNNAVLFAYPKQLQKGSKLLLYDMDNVVKDSIEINEVATELTHDYRNRVYLILNNSCLRIIINENSLDTIRMSLYHYKRYMKPIIAAANNNMFFSTYDPYHPAFDYYTYDVVDSTYTKFASVIDREMMVEYRAEYRHSGDVRAKLAAKNQEILTGVDAEIIFGRRYFSNTIYFEPPYAPMFMVKNNLFLFDYQCDSLKVFDTKAKLIFGKAITHDHFERKTGWEKQLVQDQRKNKVYAVFQKDGFHQLKEINLLSGNLKDPIKLNYRYAENIQVHNGYVYYIHRPFESYQKKFFWREKLPYD